MIVADTNIITYLLINNDYTPLAERLYQKDSDWQVPTLWRSEFRNVLALYLRKELLSLQQVIAIQKQAEKILERSEHSIDSQAVLRLAHASTCSAYDCEFVALAQELDVPLVTMDKKVLAQFADTAVSLKNF